MSNLLTRRAIAFLIALLLAIVAAVAVLNYVRGVEQDAVLDGDLVVGFVATQQIEPGTLADSAVQLGAIEETEVPSDLLPATAITDLTQITGRFVEERIVAGDIIVSDRFASPGESGSVLTLDPEFQALSLAVAVEPGVAGFVREGDFVSIIANLAAPDPSAGDGQAQGQGQGGDGAVTRTQYALQSVEVLAVGRRVESADGDAAGGTVPAEGGILLTVAVRPEDAEKLVHANLNGQVWLTLLPDDETDPVDTPGVTADTLFED